MATFSQLFLQFFLFYLFLFLYVEFLWILNRVINGRNTIFHYGFCGWLNNIICVQFSVFFFDPSVPLFIFSNAAKSEKKKIKCFDSCNFFFAEFIYHTFQFVYYFKMKWAHFQKAVINISLWYRCKKWHILEGPIVKTYFGT